MKHIFSCSHDGTIEMKVWEEKEIFQLRYIIRVRFKKLLEVMVLDTFNVLTAKHQNFVSA